MLEQKQLTYESYFYPLIPQVFANRSGTTSREQANAKKHFAHVRFGKKSVDEGPG